jgi:hypothetical protein
MTALGANHGHEIARAGTTERGNQLNKQAGPKGLSASVELDIRSYCHPVMLSQHSNQIQEHKLLRQCDIGVRFGSIATE